MAVFSLEDDNEIYFPDPELADEDGLLAIGGDLSPMRLVLAYSNGIRRPYFRNGPGIFLKCENHHSLIFNSIIIFLIYFFHFCFV